MTADVNGFNPFALTGGNYAVHGQLYDTLIRRDADKVSQPWLAESWDLAEGGESITLDLRDDVTFHSGREFTADDVVASFDYAKNSDLNLNIKPLMASVADIRSVDDHTVTIDFTHPYLGVFDMLEMMWVIDPETVDSKESPDGTGAFVLDEWNPGVSVHMSRFDDYWNGAPKIAGVEFKVVADAASLEAQLNTGELDVALRPDAASIPRLEQNEDLVVTPVYSDVENFQFNNGAPPLDNPKVREALDLAIDRNRMADEVLGTVPMCQPYLPGTPAFDEALNASCEFDIPKAKAALDESGVGDFSVSIIAATDTQVARAEIFQSDLAKIGVNASVERLDFESWVARIQASDFEIAAHSYARAGSEPSTLFATTGAWFAEGNRAQFHSDEYATMIDEALKASDPEDRIERYKELARFTMNARFVVPVAAVPGAVVSSSALSGLQLSVGGHAYLGGVQVEG